MNLNLLIESIVRQTTVLLAQLATSGGGRTQLAGTANQVFLDLVAELKRQGVGTRVIADMFGLALRTYHDKVKRLEESRSARGRSLWEAVLEHVEKSGPIARVEVVRRFRFDDEASVKGVLKDLVESGLLYRTGRGAAVIYRAADAGETPRVEPSFDAERVANFVWVSICRHEPVTESDLQAMLPIEPEQVQAALGRLLDAGRIARLPGEPDRFESTTQVIEDGDPTGWEAALFDHYQAMVTAFCTKLRIDSSAPERDWVGGSTFRFEVWQGHPLKDEVTGFLSRIRSEGTDLRARVAAHNLSHDGESSEPLRVLAYVGQTVISNDNGEDALD